MKRIILAALLVAAGSQVSAQGITCDGRGEAIRQWKVEAQQLFGDFYWMNDLFDVRLRSINAEADKACATEGEPKPKHNSRTKHNRRKRN